MCLSGYKRTVNKGVAKKGEVTYELRADDSNLETDLNEAESKIKSPSKKIEDAAKDAGMGVEQSAKESVSKQHRLMKRK